MQVWPRKRASRPVPRIRNWKGDTEGNARLLGFPVFKAGMTHVMATDARKHTPTKGETIAVPATVVEAPPIKIYSVRCYKRGPKGLVVATERVIGKDKHLNRRVHTKKQGELKDLDASAYDRISVCVHTQPSKTSLGRKRPEIIEIGLGGDPKEALAWVTEHADKEIPIAEAFAEGTYADCHGVTKGKGYSGPVKRFGIGLKPHKSEKGRRAPGSLGGWSGQQHFMYRVAHAGQMGYHQRTQFNNQILKVGENPDEVNPAGGFVGYGLVKNHFLIIQGSLQGPKKRTLLLTQPMRLSREHPAPTVEAISTVSQQGR